MGELAWIRERSRMRSDRAAEHEAWGFSAALLGFYCAPRGSGGPPTESPSVTPAFWKYVRTPAASCRPSCCWNSELASSRASTGLLMNAVSTRTDGNSTDL